MVEYVIRTVTTMQGDLVDIMARFDMIEPFCKKIKLVEPWNNCSYHIILTVQNGKNRFEVERSNNDGCRQNEHNQARVRSVDITECLKVVRWEPFLNKIARKTIQHI